MTPRIVGKWQSWRHVVLKIAWHSSCKVASLGTAEHHVCIILLGMLAWVNVEMSQVYIHRLIVEFIHLSYIASPSRSSITVILNAYLTIAKKKEFQSSLSEASMKVCASLRETVTWTVVFGYKNCRAFVHSRALSQAVSQNWSRTSCCSLHIAFQSTINLRDESYQ